MKAKPHTFHFQDNFGDVTQISDTDGTGIDNYKVHCRHVNRDTSLCG